MGYIIFFLAWFASFALFGFGGGIFSLFVLLLVKVFIDDMKKGSWLDHLPRWEDRE